MSLLMNEEFSIYQLRLGYLNHIRDGVGERLITLNPTILTPAFRLAGWTPDVAAVRRCYSPPIPTGTADVSNEYFQQPVRSEVTRLEEDFGMEGGGIVTGHQGHDEGLGTAGLLASERKRRRRKEHLEEDDSSDLSDDSEEDEKGLAQSLRFDKMPVRTRANTTDNLAGLSVTVTKASQPQESSSQRIRSGSVNVLSSIPIKRRPRGDTTTSSGMSSDDNEITADALKGRLPGRPGKGTNPLSAEDDIEEVDEEMATVDFSDDDIYDSATDSDDFGGTAESHSIFGIAAAGTSAGIPTSVKPQRHMIPSTSSPRKGMKDQAAELPSLQLRRRPISTVQPVSILATMMKGKASGSGDEPFQGFAGLSGKGEAAPLWIKIYAPFSERPEDPIEVPIRRLNEERPVTVAELIGLALFRYGEEGYKPAIASEDGNINGWTLRIVEDGEVDMDFPALVRTKAVGDFTSNNNRTRRMRDKPWDEFGLVKATKEQFSENEKLTPQTHEAGKAGKDIDSTRRPAAAGVCRQQSDNELAAPPQPPNGDAAKNRITDSVLARGTARKDSSTRLDEPKLETRHGASKTGPSRIINIRYIDANNFTARYEKFQTTSDSYIAEIFDQACKRFNLDKALYLLKVQGSTTIAPNDRTVEVLGERLQLDLTARHFRQLEGGGMFGYSGSPGSSSPTERLVIRPNDTPTGNKKKAIFTTHPYRPELHTQSGAGGLGGDGKRYNVLRKQPLSFAGTHPRTLIITPEFVTIMPAAPDSLAAPTGKVTNIPTSSIVGAKVVRKHPKNVRILVIRSREKEKKQYDFEAADFREAEAIVADVKGGMAAYGEG